MPDNDLKILDWLLKGCSAIDYSVLDSIHDWKQLYDKYSKGWEKPVDRAIIGGFAADRLAYAFAAGYESALRRLIPSIPDNSITALCVTEQGSAHPGSIKTSLEEIKGIDENEKQWVLNGTKSFVTLAVEAELLLIAASMGTDADGKNIIRLVLIERNSSGVDVNVMEDLPFIPEVSHGVVHLENVPVGEPQLLHGDGYTEYIRPFRTIEDLHVFASIIGYLFRIARIFSWPEELREQMLSILVSVRSLAIADPQAPWVHIAVGGVLKQMDSLLSVLSPCWESVDDKIRSAWERDSALLKIAGNARLKRLEKAWSCYK